METRKVDVAVIGGGTAGLNARREVERMGGEALLIQDGPWGTTCARVGCMPSKLLIAAADAAHAVEGAGRFGIEIDGQRRIDGSRVMARVREHRDRFVAGVMETVQRIPEQLRIEGRARLESPTRLRVGDLRVEARAVVVATGSAPVVPPPYDAVREHVLTSDELFELETLPKSLAVAGTGIIGLELGQALHRLGVEVRFFSPEGRLGLVTDPAVAAVVSRTLGDELALSLESSVQAATPVPGGIHLRWRERSGERREQVFEKVLVAAGRRPALAGLGLEAIGLPLDARGLPPWDPRTTRCGDLPVFLAGDASGHLPLLHEAADEGRIAGQNAMLFPDVATRERRTPLAIAFTAPQMAVAGRRHAELDVAAIEIGEASFENQGRAVVLGENRGLVRLYAERQGARLVGAELFAPHAEHLAHLLAWTIQQGMRVPDVLRLPFYHPVLEEGLRTALRELAKRTRVTRETRCEDMATVPGA